MIGFAGQISALSGINNSGLGAFQHMLSDYSGTSSMNMAYEPVWFTLRDALEKKDFNSDGFQNVNDVKDAISIHTNGFADGYIISALAPSTTGFDSLTALVAEITPTNPFLTFRTNSYPDSIPGDNLYTANYEIARNDHLHFCIRYNKTRNGLENGTGISANDNWQIMRDSSNSGTSNIQFMQFIPEWRQLKISVYKSSLPAYYYSPCIYDLDEMFNNTVGEEQQEKETHVLVFPNPVNDRMYLKTDFSKTEYVNITLYSISGDKILQIYNGEVLPGNQLFSFSTNIISDGVYICKINSDTYSEEIKIGRAHV